MVLNKQKYITQMEVILSDSSTYEVVRYDPLKKIINFLTSIISRWKQKEYIDVYTYRRIYCGNLPRAYGLSKQAELPRIIVSIINSSLFSIFSFLKKYSESLNKVLSWILISWSKNWIVLKLIQIIWWFL